jgi:hypothetical protein
VEKIAPLNPAIKPRDVKDLLAECGSMVSNESMCQWCSNSGYKCLELAGDTAKKSTDDEIVV